MASEEPSSTGHVTRLLREARGGKREALDQVVPLVYDDLLQLARRQLGYERVPRTVQPTTLVHEAYLKLAGGGALDASDRAHFLAIAARAMRQVLVDQARRRGAAKRGAGWQRTTLSDAQGSDALDPAELLALNDALEQLEARQRQVVECRFFGGMEEQEIAIALGVSERTVRRDWVKARAWLNRILYVDPGADPGPGTAPPRQG